MPQQDHQPKVAQFSAPALRYQLVESLLIQTARHLIQSCWCLFFNQVVLESVSK